MSHGRCAVRTPGRRQITARLPWQGIGVQTAPRTPGRLPRRSSSTRLGSPASDAPKLAIPPDGWCLVTSSGARFQELHALIAACLFTLSACGAAPEANSPSEVNPSPYLYVWAGAEDDGDSDFLAVLDADPASATYAQIVATAPVGLRGGAHHSEHTMPSGDSLFVNSFRAGTTFVIDLSDPTDPAVASSFGGVGEYTYPHTFERLPNGNVLATFQTKGEGNEVAGGLVELDPAGNLVRVADAVDPVDPELRAYSVTPIPRLDRAVSTTSDMWGEAAGTSFQVWRLSDLELLRTVRLQPGPGGYEHRDPAEVRLLADSTTAMMTTFTCALYLLRDLVSEDPSAELVYALPWSDYDTGDCGIPATWGDIWLQTYRHSDGAWLISYDISEPSAPVELDRLAWDGDWWPHWISIEPGGRRVVLTSGPGETHYRILVVRMDPDTGALEFDETFRDAGAAEPGVLFDRSSWPHGQAGAARPHGAVFSGGR